LEGDGVSTATLLVTSVALLAAGALVSLALARRRMASGWASVGFAGAAGAAMWVVVVRTFSAGPAPEVTLLSLPGIGAGLVLHVDCLSAIFLAITGTIGFLATLYSVQHMTRYRNDSVAKYYPVLQLLFAGIVGVVATADFVFFLVFWELMTFASFFLVTFERENRASQKAGLKYFVVNQAATFGMIAGALILWTRSGSFHYSAMREALGTLLGTHPALAHLVLFLFFMGFATKAGILPMGDWLPDAYPAAPSGATAAFGGTMTKLGVYGLLRVFLGFLPLSPLTRTWGVVIALAGAASLFVGTLTALKQDDIKRLMSFHVIGQVGYMFLGIGFGLFFLPTDPALAALGLLAGTFHMVNHSLYKSCLFLGAGAVSYRTGSRSLSALGGLRAFMPATAMFALTAALAIAGVPPLNGFASKWLMYATGILGGQAFPLFALLAIVAMFISLVTLASFLKYLGSAFLGPPSPLKGVREVPASMLVPQAFLALTCVVFGLAPGWPLGFVHRALTGLASAASLPTLATLLGGGPGLRVVSGTVGVAFWAPLPIALCLVLLGLASYFLIQRAAGASVREVPVWTCGEEAGAELSRYPASSFYLPFKRAFQGIYPTIQVRSPAFPRWLRRAFDLDSWFYLPFARAVEGGARGVSRTHVGIPQVYLLWIVVGAIAVIGIVLAAMG
jgi:hydrogenase-4 component B